MLKLLTAFTLIFFFLKTSQAEEGLLQIKLPNNEATLPVYEISKPESIATVILLPGGDAGTGQIIDGKPMSGNFLSRSKHIFFQENMNVLVMYRASNLNSMDFPYRISSDHIHEIQEVITYAKSKFKKPVWLIGTSRGSVSATAATIALGPDYINGMVLTSSITNGKIGAIRYQNIEKINIPTLVIHHANDSCKICNPQEASQIINHLKLAPYKKFIEIQGGHSPEGNPCEAKHWHGFINYEKETVKIITDWIKNPSN